MIAVMPMSDDSRPAHASLLSAGFRCRCPRCGEGRLYEGVLQVRERCAVCGFDLRKADPGDGPAVFIILVLGALVVLLAVLVEFWLAPPLWLHAVVWGVFILGAAIAMLRPAKALLIALQFGNRASDSGTVDYDTRD